jgi:hypothetical protein
MPKNDEIAQRVNGLEKKGRKRGKIYSVVGILAMIIIFAGSSYGIYYYLKDINKVSNQANDNLLVQKDEIQKNVECVGDIDCVDKQNNCPSGDCSGGRFSCQESKCVFVKDINNNCVVEGGALDLVASSTSTCCEGLKATSSMSVSQDGICQISTSTTVCVKCNDGVCGIGENKCNCPQDCLQTASSTDITNNLNQNNSTSTLNKNECGSSSCPIIKNENNASSSNNIIDPNLDTDNDSLSDIDEAKYGTDPNNPDTDGDGYKDGDEVKGGYNPKGAGKL